MDFRKVDKVIGLRPIVNCGNLGVAQTQVEKVSRKVRDFPHIKRHSRHWASGYSRED
jgi:hypothetical protein